jgi:uncharacterized paraquat-inducible protein A
MIERVTDRRTDTTHCPDCDTETPHAVRDGVDGPHEYTEAECKRCGSTVRVRTGTSDEWAYRFGHRSDNRACHAQP